MTTFFLVRHAVNDWFGDRLAGWQAGVHLNETGRAQAARVARRLADSGVTAVVSSPLERALETAEPLARHLALPVERLESLGEIRCGDWTGRKIADLDAGDSQWRLFNSFRGGTRAPSGELMLETQTRMVAEVLRLRDRHPDGAVACFSHADPLRALLAYLLGTPIDLALRIELSPASLSVVRLDSAGVLVRSVNETAHLD